MRIHFLGVRGSTPAPGIDFVRVGGNTSCVAIAHDGAAPTLVLDAGTGLRRLTSLLEGAPFRGTILLTHLHWDHLQGLPFFAAGDRADADVTLALPEPGDPVEVLGRAMSPPHFPIGPDGLRGHWCFDSITPGRHQIEGFEVLALEVAHKGGRTYGYRISDGHSSVAYLPDHATGPPDQAERLVAGVDLLIHDAQFVEAERAVATDYGHATVDDAVALATKAGVGRLALFHHGPDRTDDQVLAISTAAASASGGPDVVAATESDVLDLPSRAVSSSTSG